MMKTPDIRYDGDTLIVTTWHPAPLYRHSDAGRLLCIARHGQIAMQAVEDAITAGAWLRSVKALYAEYNDATTAAFNAIVVCSAFYMGNVPPAQV